MDNKTVTTGVGVVIWDGINRPETDDVTGERKYSIQFAFLPSDPSFVFMNQAIQLALQEDTKFNGTLPPGGVQPILDVDPQKIPELPGHKRFTAKSKQIPPVYNADASKALSPMEFANHIYPGAKVRLLIHSYTFDNKSKGVAFALDGIQVIDSNQATAPKLAIAGGLSAQEVQAQFAGSATPGVPAPATSAPVPAAAAAPAPQAPISPHPGFASADQAPPPPATPQMTAKANGATYESFIQNGWNDETLRQHGYIV